MYSKVSENDYDTIGELSVVADSLSQNVKTVSQPKNFNLTGYNENIRTPKGRFELFVSNDAKCKPHRNESISGSADYVRVLLTAFFFKK